MLYQRMESPLHRLNPAGKLILLILFFCWVLLLTTPLTALAPFLTALFALVIARSLPNLRRSLPLLLVFSITSLLLWSLLTTGHTPLFHLGTIIFYREALLYALAMAIRLDAMLMGGLVFVSTTSVEELRFGLCQLRIPYPIAFAISLAFRLVPNFAEALEKAIQAQKLRGLALDQMGLVTRLRNYAPLIIPVILISLRNTDQLAVALEARGFGRAIPRTSFLSRPWRMTDTCACLLLLTVIIACLCLRLKGVGVLLLP